MLIFAVIPLPRNPDGLIYHVFLVNGKVNADALRSGNSVLMIAAYSCIMIPVNYEKKDGVYRD
jgi:hypothetical protein